MPEPEPGLSAGSDPAAVWRDAADAGVRYWTRLGGLAFALAETLVPAVGELRPRPTVRRETGVAAPAPAREERQEQTIVIEAAAGKSGIGVFMVENTTPRAVTAPVVVSAFVDESGREASPEVTFSPPVLTLDAGDQVLVQVAAAVDDGLEPGVRYRAEITIPHLSTAGIPIVVRRRPAAARRSKKPA